MLCLIFSKPVANERVLALHAALRVTMVRAQKSAFVGGEFLLDLAVTHTYAGYAASAAIADIVWIHVSAPAQ